MTDENFEPPSALEVAEATAASDAALDATVREAADSKHEPLPTPHSKTID